MELVFTFHEREILRVKDAATLGELPRRGDDIVLTDPLTGVTWEWGVIRVQHYYAAEVGPLGRVLVRIELRQIEQSRYAPNPLEV